MTDLAAFIEDYRKSWEDVMNDRRDVDVLTPFFHVPCLMFGADGTMTQYQSEAEIVAFNESRRDSFKAGNATLAELRGVDTQSLGQHLALAIVNWELKRSDGSLERSWRHYYTIRRSGDDAAILVSTFQAGS